jgi:hypothetical protein
VSSVNGDAALSLFGSLIDGRVIGVLSLSLVRKELGDGSGKSGLAVVDVTDGADVHMGFGSVIHLFCHFIILQFFNRLIN